MRGELIYSGRQNGGGGDSGGTGVIVGRDENVSAVG